METRVLPAETIQPYNSTDITGIPEGRKVAELGV